MIGMAEQAPRGAQPRDAPSAAHIVQQLRLCYCEGHCPDGRDNGTCELKPGGVCFTSVEAVSDEYGDEYPHYTYGCFPDDERGFMQCKGNLVPHQESKSIQCCDDADLCNRGLRPMYVESPRAGVPGSASAADGLTFVVLLTSVTFCLTLLLLVVAVCYVRYRRKETRRSAYVEKELVAAASSDETDIRGPLASLVERSSGSGSGLPILVQRTISKQLQMVRPVGKGRFGEVWLAKWRGEKVAVKVFLTTEESSWFRETEIYQTVLMRHDNILGFVAADIKGVGSWTQMFLITEFHENGSLFDYLKERCLDGNGLIKMSRSLAAGLSHLHTEIFGTRGKPAIAHRDLKSKNILVKRDGECCIADFGLAVKFSGDIDEVEAPPVGRRSGTRRYMAPELLMDRNTFGSEVTSFEGHKAADMYALGLVLWEMARRTASGGKLKAVDEYAAPYHDVVPAEPPALADMRVFVCERGVRPPQPKRWQEDGALRAIAHLMRECWHQDPAVRLTALRVKKTLCKLEESNLDVPNAPQVV